VPRGLRSVFHACLTSRTDSCRQLLRNPSEFDCHSGRCRTLSQSHCAHQPTLTVCHQSSNVFFLVALFLVAVIKVTSDPLTKLYEINYLVNWFDADWRIQDACAVAQTTAPSRNFPLRVVLTTERNVCLCEVESYRATPTAERSGCWHGPPRRCWRLPRYDDWRKLPGLKQFISDYPRNFDSVPCVLPCR